MLDDCLIIVYGSSPGLRFCIRRGVRLGQGSVDPRLPAGSDLALRLRFRLRDESGDFGPCLVRVWTILFEWGEPSSLLTESGPSPAKSGPSPEALVQYESSYDVRFEKSRAWQRISDQAVQHKDPTIQIFHLFHVVEDAKVEPLRMTLSTQEWEEEKSWPCSCTWFSIVKNELISAIKVWKETLDFLRLWQESLHSLIWLGLSTT